MFYVCFSALVIVHLNGSNVNSTSVIMNCMLNNEELNLVYFLLI
jgi:hypothetical protein